MVIIRASLGSERMSEKQKPNDLFDAPNMLVSSAAFLPPAYTRIV
jgi:hypothetical protein